MARFLSSKFEVLSSKFAVAAALCILIALTPARQVVGQQQTPPTFRAATLVVPVDVRIVDRAGKPVTDLRREDFTILENGVPQDIAHFSTESFGAPGSPAAVASASQPGRLIPAPSHRVFLIVLGRGRLQVPARGVDGLIHFMKERLRPDDRVAVLAYDRATQFTTDHASTVALLERFKRIHERIETRLRTREGGLTGIYGSREPLPVVRADIDEIFGGPKPLPTRRVVPGEIVGAADIEREQRRVTDLLLGTSAFDVSGAAEVERLGVSLEEYTLATVQTMQDVTKLYSAVDYLRFVEGEKHLIFVSEEGLTLPDANDDRNLARVAADARVTINYVHTGGVLMGEGRGGRAVGGGTGGGGGRGGRSLAPPVGPSRQSTFVQFMAARTLATTTGGQFNANRLRDAADDLDRVDDATRFQYLLGYYPRSQTLDGRFRNIEVRVNRPGLTVLYRHGYFAREAVPMSARTRITVSRVSGAAGYPEDVRDLAVTATAYAPQASSTEVTVGVAIPGDRITLTREGRVNTGSLEVAIFCLDGQNTVGQLWQTAELTFSEDKVSEFRQNGFRYTFVVPVSARARRVKVVAYDFAADLVGSITASIEDKPKP